MASAVAVNAAQTPAKTGGEMAENPRDRPENAVAAPDSRRQESDEARWRPLLGLPGELTVDLPLPDFRVVDLLQMEAGAVMRTGWQVARDVPLRVNNTLIGWSEFEAVGDRLAVRLTELA